MHWSAEWLTRLDDDELLEALEWARTKEKHHRRRGAFGLSCAWGGMAFEIVTEYGNRQREIEPEFGEQLALDHPGMRSISPELRSSVWPT